MEITNTATSIGIDQTQVFSLSHLEKLKDDLEKIKLEHKEMLLVDAVSTFILSKREEATIKAVGAYVKDVLGRGVAPSDMKWEQVSPSILPDLNCAWRLFHKGRSVMVFCAGIIQEKDRIWCLAFDYQGRTIDLKTP